MKERKTPLSFVILYWMMNIITALFLLAILLGLIVNILFYTGFFGNDLQLHVAMPVKVNILETGTLAVPGGPLAMELVDASSRIHFIDTPLPLARKFGLIMLGVMGLGLYISLTLRQFIANVKNGKVFDVANIFLLQRISYALLGFWLVLIVYTRLAYHYFAKFVEVPGVEVLNDFNNYPGVLLAALFIWVLSHIFIRGVKLQEEQDLTV